MQDAERQFAAENPVQISPDSQNRDCKQHETDPDADADHTVQQADAGFSKAVEYAGESGVQVQKRTDIGHGMDIDSGCLTVKQKISKKFSKKQQKKTKQDPPSSRQYRENPADHILDSLLIPQSLQLGNGGESAWPQPSL